MQIRAMLRLTLLFCAVSLIAEDDSPSLFNQHCSPCHGGDGAGKTQAGGIMKLPDLRSQEVQRLTDDALYETIGNGAGHKQYPHTFLRKGLTEAQVRQVVRYLRSLKPIHASGASSTSKPHP